MKRLAAIALGVVFAELAARLLLPFFDEPVSAAEIEESLDESLARMGSAGERFDDKLPPRPVDAILHPYIGFETVRGFRELISHYRVRKDVPTTDGKEPFVLLLLGGSVAEAVGGAMLGGADRLCAKIEADPRFADREVVVLNHGRPAFKQPQQLMLAGYMFSLGVHPDVVVNIDGYNEVALGALNGDYGLHPIFPSIEHWGTLAIARLLDERARMVALEHDAKRLVARAKGMRATSSAIVGSLVRASVERMARRHRTQMKALRTDPPPVATFSPDPSGFACANAGVSYDSVLDAAVDNWFESSLSLDALCRTRGIPYLHVLQPTLLDTGSKQLTPQERAYGEIEPVLIDAVRDGYPRLREAGARLRERGVAFHDASDVFAGVEETVYEDECHFGRPWTEKLGDGIADALLASFAENGERAP